MKYLTALICALLAVGVGTVMLADVATAAQPACPVKEPIRVGDLSSMSGPFHFPESQLATRLTFDAINEHCGINGRSIEYTVLDDAGDPEKAKLLAQELRPVDI